MVSTTVPACDGGGGMTSAAIAPEAAVSAKAAEAAVSAAAARAQSPFMSPSLGIERGRKLPEKLGRNKEIAAMRRWMAGGIVKAWLRPSLWASGFGANGAARLAEALGQAAENRAENPVPETGRN